MKSTVKFCLEVIAVNKACSSKFIASSAHYAHINTSEVCPDLASRHCTSEVFNRNGNPDTLCHSVN